VRKKPAPAFDINVIGDDPRKMQSECKAKTAEASSSGASQISKARKIPDDVYHRGSTLPKKP
jgi:hypothetical protein